MNSDKLIGITDLLNRMLNDGVSVRNDKQREVIEETLYELYENGKNYSDEEVGKMVNEAINEVITKGLNQKKGKK